MSWNELPNQALLFFPIWIRVFSFLQMAPLFSSPFVFTRLKVVLALIIAWWSVPILEASGAYQNLTLGIWLLCIAGEGLLGILQAFIVSIFYETLQIASQFFSYQMGLTIAQLSDPLSHSETPIVGQLLSLLALEVFLSSNGLFSLFWIGITESIQQVNVFMLFHLQEKDFRDLLITIFSQIFSKSFLLSLPIIGVLFIVNFLTGLLAKASPQINLLVMIFPISIALGLYVIWMGLPILSHSYNAILDQSFSTLKSFLSFLRGSLS